MQQKAVGQRQRENMKVQRKRQERLILALGAGIIAASVVTTVWISGVLGGRGSTSGYQNVTFTDAVLNCESQVRQTYRSQLQNLTLDDHSSRFDQPSYQYKIFFKAQMSSKAGTTASDFYLNCYVSADRGNIATLDAYEQKEAQTEAIRKDQGGLFGWPMGKKS